MTTPIYLDGFASLPLAPEARDAMLEAWSAPGNAGSPNVAGERAARIIAEGRREVAELIGAAPSEIVFTSGATEANNLALLGVVAALGDLEPTRRRILISSIEHKAVIEPARALEKRGFELCLAPVDNQGRLDLDAFTALATSDLLFASVMLVNNETGVVQPVAEAAKIVHAAGGFIHSDAAQAAGKIDIDVTALDVDYLSLSAHKCYGPMGIGALFMVAGSVRPKPQSFGGGQQEAMRPGTEPVALIAGFGAAARAARTQLAHDDRHGRQLIEQLLAELSVRQIRFDRITGDAPTVPGSAAIALANVDADALCGRVARHVSLSTGSACTSGQIDMSHVLNSMGFSSDRARRVIRIFCHRYQDEADILFAAEHIATEAERSRLVTGGLHQ